MSTTTLTPSFDNASDADLFGAWCAAENQGIRLLKHIWAENMTVETLMLNGHTKPRATQLHRAAAIFFKPTRFRRAHAKLVADAQEKNLTLDTLLGIAQQIRLADAHPQHPETKLLGGIIHEADGTTDDTVRRAKQQVSDHNRRVRQDQEREAASKGETLPAPEPRYISRNTPDARGMLDGTLSAPGALLALINDSLRSSARKLMRENPQLGVQEAMGREAVNRLLPGNSVGPVGSGGTGASTSNGRGLPPVTCVGIVTVDGLLSLASNSPVGTNESTFGTTNGAELTERDITEAGLADFEHHRVLIMTPDGEPVDLFKPLVGQPGVLERVNGRLNKGRESRGMNSKQRLVAEATYLQCQWPGCDAPATDCDGHHLQAWNDGGTTDQDNLTLLCKTHNGRNDDDRTRPNNGYIFKVTTENGSHIYYQPPNGAAPILVRNGRAHLSGVEIAKKQRRLKMLALPDEVPKDPPETEPEPEKAPTESGKPPASKSPPPHEPTAAPLWENDSPDPPF